MAATTAPRWSSPFPAAPTGWPRSGGPARSSDPQRRPGRHQVTLADHVVERPWPQPRPQAGPLAEPVRGRRREQVRGRRQRRRRGDRPAISRPRSRQAPRAQWPRGVMRSPARAVRTRASALGAPVMGSVPDWVLGKAITSRMFSSPAQQGRRSGRRRQRTRRAAERRSGTPRAGTRSGPRLPPAVIPSASKTRRWMSSRWIRIDPDPSSQPFSTRS